MIAIDTNLLVYAHRQDSQFHEVAYSRIQKMAEGQSSWAIPWPCIHEFLAIVTHPRIYAPPTPLQRAIEQVEAWLESPTLVLLSEPENYWSYIKDLLQKGLITGPQVHDARIAALCRAYGVRELWTADRDFSRFPGTPIYNPLVSSPSS